MTKSIFYINLVLFYWSFQPFQVETNSNTKHISAYVHFKANKFLDDSPAYKNNKRKLQQEKNYIYSHGGIIRGDTAKKELALVFTGDSYADGGNQIIKTLKKHKIKASFFFTGIFYRNPEFSDLIKQLVSDSHYLGAHSDKHLLYCSWENRDSLLVNKNEFLIDLQNNYQEMQRFGIPKNKAQYFMPPYEWYNDQISQWTNEFGLTLINFSPGTRSNADYTTPDMGNRYISSERIFNSILQFEQENKSGLNGFILLVHIGTDSRRIDKFYLMIDPLISELRKRDYDFVRIDNLLE